MSYDSDKVILIRAKELIFSRIKRLKKLNETPLILRDLKKHCQTTPPSRLIKSVGFYVEHET